MNKKLSKSEIKQKIAELIKDKLFILSKEEILKTLKRLDIDINEELTKDNLIAQINDKISKKRTTIYYELYKDNKKIFGIGPTHVEELLGISKHQRLKLQKHKKLPINYYFQCKMRGSFVDIPMYDPEFILNKVGTDYINKELNRIDKESKAQAIKNRKLKRKKERETSAIDKHILKINSRNEKLLNNLLKSNKYLLICESTEELGKFILSNIVAIQTTYKYEETISWNKNYKLIAYNSNNAIIKRENCNRELYVTYRIVIKEDKNNKKNNVGIVEILDIEVNKEDLIAREKEKTIITDKIANKLIIFDTETTDLHPGEICQLSYVILDKDNIEEGIKLARNMFFQVKKVSSGALKVHGLSESILAELSCGYTFKDYADIIYNDFEDAEIIGHNINFDFDFLLDSLEKSINKKPKFKRSFCTMHYYTDILKIHHPYYGYKFPKLEEVISYLNINHSEIKDLAIEVFNNCNDYHDSRFDVIATYLIYINA